MNHDAEDRYANCLLALGLVLGSLRDTAIFDRIANSLSDQRLSAHYVRATRDALTRVLDVAGMAEGAS
jgi:hypothetical protein